jgi:hypothetical protein
MGVSYTHEDFVTKSKEIHCDKYDYIYDTYKGMSIKFKVYCKDHGIFEIKPAQHIHAKQGCKKCYLSDKIDSHKKMHSDKLINKHKGKYTVQDWLSFTKLRDNVLLSCKDHGTYETQLTTALQTSFGGCLKCKVYEESKVFVTKAQDIHGDKYSYELNDYESSRKVMRIWCNTHEDYFYQRPSAHLQGQNCPLCGKDSCKVTKNCNGKDSFILRAKEVHGEFYDYSKVDYVDITTKVTLVCPVHGDYQIIPNNHIHGHGECISCGVERRKAQKWMQFEDKISKIPEYSHMDFSGSVYINNRTPIKARCTKHNEYFTATTNKLLDLKTKVIGCASCRKLSNNRWTISGIRNIPDIESKKGCFYTGSISTLEGFKLGICSDLKDRMGMYKGDLNKTGHKFSYSKVRELSYLEAAVIEVILKKMFKAYMVNHDIEFGGKNEVFNPPVYGYVLVEDVFSGVFDHEISILATIATHNNHESILNFIELLKRKYNVL